MSTRAWRIALFVLIGAGLAFALRPLQPHQGPENWFPQADKLHHLWYFGLLWWMGLRAGFRHGWGLALGLVALGVGIELAQQLLTESRKASVSDVLADSAGIALGWAFTRWRAARALARQPEVDRG